MKIEIKVENKMLGSERFEVNDFVVKFPIHKQCGKPNIAVTNSTFITEGDYGVWTIGKLVIDKRYTLSGKIPIP